MFTEHILCSFIQKYYLVHLVTLNQIVDVLLLEEGRVTDHIMRQRSAFPKAHDEALAHTKIFGGFLLR